MRIEDLHLRFGDKVVFDGLTLDVSEGICCLIGANGSGKTTLLRLIAGLIQPDAGRIVGAPARPSVCFQEDRLLPWLDVLANVTAVGASPEQAARWLARLGLGDRLHAEIASLSGGMKRRTALARAFAYGGDMLLLDEPVKGLDGLQKQAVSEILRELKIPVLISAHSEEEFRELAPTVIRLG